VEELMTIIQTAFVDHYMEWLSLPVILIIGYFAIKMVDRFVGRFFDQVDYDRTLEVLFQKTIKAFLWIIVFIIALANAGFNVSGFIAGLSVMGFIVGFAVKDVLSNLCAGIFLLVKRPFYVGETVVVANIQGRVDSMTLASCIVITENNEFVTIPNSKIWGNPIRNLSRLTSK
jgi:small conductance mechanosensitive channel